jgi:ABC-type dipeptide/oligopeptide/nickel transport system permease subunit
MKAGLKISLSGRIGAVMIGVFVFLGIFGPWLAPYDPTAVDLDARFLAPSSDH